MSSSKIDTIYVRFMGDAKSYMASAAAVSRSLDGLNAKFVAFNANMSRFVLLPLTIMGGLSVAQFARMDQAMTKSLSIMGDMSSVMRNDLQQAAIDLSMVTNLSQNKIAEGYFFLASAGFDAAQSLNAIGTVSQFAVAGAFDLARATDLLTDAQSALGLTVSDNSQNMLNMARVADVLTSANMQANATVEQFSIALTSKAATSMRVFNLEIEEGVAVLAAYADQGVKAELAGTSYDRVLRLLSKSAMDNREAHQAFGLEVFDATGKMRNMVPILQDLEKGMKGMSEEEKVATLASLGFEARIQQAIFPLIGMSDAIQDYKDNLLEAGGATDEVANKIMQGFTAQLVVTVNHIKAVARDIGERLAPGILRLGSAVRLISNVWLGMNDTLKSAIVILAKTVVIFGAIGLVVPMAAKAISFFTAQAVLGFTATTSLNGALAMTLGFFTKLGKAARWVIAIVNPFTKIKLLLIAIVTSAAALFTYFSGSGSIGEAWDKIALASSIAKENVLGFFESWETNWPRIKQLFKDFYENLGTNMTAIFKNMKTNLGAFVMFAAKAFGILVGWLIANAPTIAANFAGAMIDGFVKAFNYAQKLTLKFTIHMVNAFAVMGKAIVRVFGAAMTGVMRAVIKTVTFTGRIMAALKDLDFAKAAKLGLQAASAISTDLAIGAISAAAAVASGAKEALSPLVNEFNEGLMIGLNTDDLMGSLSTALDESGFVNPLAGTSLMDFPGFDTSRAFDESQSIDPFAENLLFDARGGNEWVIDFGADTDDAEDKVKDLGNLFQESMGIDIGGSSDAAAKQIVAMSNARNQRNADFMKAEKAEKAQKKAEREAARAEREKAKAEEQKRWREQLGKLTDIKSILKKIENKGVLGIANLR